MVMNTLEKQQKNKNIFFVAFVKIPIFEENELRQYSMVYIDFK